MWSTDAGPIINHDRWYVSDVYKLQITDGSPRGVPDKKAGEIPLSDTFIRINFC